MSSPAENVESPPPPTPIVTVQDESGNTEGASSSQFDPRENSGVRFCELDVTWQSRGVSLEEALLCPRCQRRPLAAELVFSCNHKFCGPCVGEISDVVTGDVRCTQCPPTTTQNEHRFIKHSYQYFETHNASSAESSITSSRILTATVSNELSPPRGSSNTGVLPKPDEGNELSPQFDYTRLILRKTLLNNEILNVDNFWMTHVVEQPITKELFVSDGYNHKIHVLGTGKEYKYSFGEEGRGSGQFKQPCGIAVTEDGYIIIADKANHRIQILVQTGEQQFTTHLEFGRMGTSKEQFWEIHGISYWGNEIYVSDYKTVKVFTREGTLQRYFTHPEIKLLFGLFVNKYGVYASDSNGHYIYVFNHDGVFRRTVGGLGKTDGLLVCPTGVVVDQQGFILVSDHYNKRVQIFTPEGSFYCGKNVRSGPRDLALCESGELVVTHFRYAASAGSVNLYM